ncbi:QRFP-like peptide receptor [Bolinopsis microptera]|uniref:QRFP-like peptide receptor n=1 Tax=Bolinopsis microptera TaxID=2820187 RepID=UPI0030792271
MHNNQQTTALQGDLSSAEKFIWISYLLIVLLSSVLGDTVILVASIKYKAFRLHEFVVTVIQHIAVCDLLLGIRTVLFRIVPIIAEEWILGDILCFVNAYSSTYLFTASFLLVCVLTISKAVLLKYPLRTSSMTIQRAHLICALTWMCSFSLPLSWVIVDKYDIFIDARVLLCRYHFSAEIWRTLSIPGHLLVIGLITFVVCASVHSVVILAKAKKAGEKSGEVIKWQGVTTIVMTLIILIIALVPTIVFHLVERYQSVEDQYKLYKSARITTALFMLTVMSNFYIYCLTVSSFRQFLRARFHEMSSRVLFLIMSKLGRPGRGTGHYELRNESSRASFRRSTQRRDDIQLEPV